MESRLIGHRWNPGSSISPRLTLAQETAGEHVHSSNSTVSAYWTLDYEFLSYGRYRVGSDRAPWKHRAPRTAHLYPPGVRYWEDTRMESGYRHSAWICFMGGEAAGLDRLIDQNERYARFVDGDGQIGFHIRRIAQIGQRSGERGFWEAQALLCRLIEILLAAERAAGEGYLALEEGTPPAFCDRVEQYLRSNLSGKVSLKEIAEHLHVSASSLSHRYRSETGETPMRTLARLRMNHARSLLLKGMPLKSIAPRLGFSDAFHLSKSFKRDVGMSPKEYLRKRGKGNLGEEG